MSYSSLSSLKLSHSHSLFAALFTVAVFLIGYASSEYTLTRAFEIQKDERGNIVRTVWSNLARLDIVAGSECSTASGDDKICVQNHKPLSKGWREELSARAALAGANIALLLAASVVLILFLHLWTRKFNFITGLAIAMIVAVGSFFLHSDVSIRFAINNPLMIALSEGNSIGYRQSPVMAINDISKMSIWNIDGALGYAAVLFGIVLLFFLCFRERGDEWKRPERLKERMEMLFIIWFLMIAIMSIGVIGAKTHLQWPASLLADDEQRMSLMEVAKSISFLYGAYLSIMVVLLPLPCLLVIIDDTRAAAREHGAETPKQVNEWREENALNLLPSRFLVPIGASLIPLFSPQLIDFVSASLLVQGAPG